MLKTIIIIAVLGLVVAVISTLSSKQKTGKKTASSKIPSPIKPVIPLSANEQPMYYRLVEALPDHIVLAQVAFSALLSCKDQARRNKYNRARADFIVCTKSFEVVAAVELDDSSHIGQEDRDAGRDAFLIEAGYKVLRYKKTPDISALRKDFAELATKPTPKIAA